MGRGAQHFGRPKLGFQIPQRLASYYYSEFCRVGFLGGLILLGLSDPAMAQSVPEQDLNIIQRQQEQILNREAERLNRLEEERRRRADEDPVIEGVPPLPPSLPPTDQCHDIEIILVEGVSLLDHSDITTVTQPFQNRCLGIDQINEILRELTKLYVDAGYVTTRAYIPAQDLSTGQLKITVVEGYVEGLKIDGREDDDGFRLQTAFPGLDGRPLNLRDIEQGLDQMNRLKSVTAKMRLEPGSEQGASQVVIEEQKTIPFHLTMAVDNTGSAATGENQRYITLEADNLLRANDYLSLQFKGDSMGSGAESDSDSFSGSWSIPYGYWTLTASASHFRYLSLVQGTSQSFESKGTSRTYEMTVSRRLHRDQDSKTDLDLSLKHKNDRNFVAGTLLSSSTRRQTIAGIELGHQRRALGGAVDVSIGLEQGLRWFNAKQDLEKDGGEPQAQFRKGLFDLSYQGYLPTEHVTFGYSLTASGQVSRDSLYSGQQIGIGGLYSVRGFKEDTLTGDIGGYVQNEIFAIANLPQGRIKDVIGSPTIYLGFDVGALRDDREDSEESGGMKGWVAGLRASGGYLGFDVSYARAISGPSHIEARHHEVYFLVSLNL